MRSLLCRLVIVLRCSILEKEFVNPPPHPQRQPATTHTRHANAEQRTKADQHEEEQNNTAVSTKINEAPSRTQVPQQHISL